MTKGDLIVLNATMHKALRLAASVQRMLVEGGFGSADIDDLRREFRNACQTTQRLLDEDD